MKSFVVLFALVGLVLADVSHLGYQYKVPHTSYGVPTYAKDSANLGYSKTVPQYQLPEPTSGFQGQLSQSSGGSSFQYQQPSNQFTSGQSTSGNSFQYQGASQQNYPLPASQFVSHDEVTGGSANSGFGVTSTSAGQQSSGAVGHQTFGSGSLNYQTSGISQTNFQSVEKASAQSYKQQYVQVQQQAPQIFKHFYVHAAPEEPEVPRVRQVPVLPPPQKHYKVIFIKTPTPPAPPAPVIPIQPQHEEKTLVYVLVQKPEEPTEYVVPKVEQKPPSKPEVFFIKYSGKDGSQAAINNIVQDINANTAHTGSLVSQSSGSGLSLSPNIVESTLSDSSVTSGAGHSSGDLSGFSSGVSSLSSGLSGGAVNSGSITVSQGALETGHTQFINTPSVEQASTFVSPSVQQGSTFVAPSHSYQTAVHDNVNEISSGVVSQNNIGYAESQDSSFSNVQGQQGLPHATYGIPNFRQ